MVLGASGWIASILLLCGHLFQVQRNTLSKKGPTLDTFIDLGLILFALFFIIR